MRVWVSVSCEYSHVILSKHFHQSNLGERSSIVWSPLLLSFNLFPSSSKCLTTDREKGKKERRETRRRRRGGQSERSPDYRSPSCWTVRFGARALDKQFGQVQSEPCIDRVLATTGRFNVTVCLSVSLSLWLLLVERRHFRVMWPLAAVPLVEWPSGSLWGLWGEGGSG